jgi:hypothetical protein
LEIADKFDRESSSPQLLCVTLALWIVPRRVVQRPAEVHSYQIKQEMQIVLMMSEIAHVPKRCTGVTQSAGYWIL